MPVNLSGSNISTFSNGARSAPTDKNQQFSGYQYGTFPATVTSTGGGSTWMVDGVSLSTYSYTYSSFLWWRVGQIVTINVYWRGSVAGGASDSSAFVIKNLPYMAKESNINGKLYHAFAACLAADMIAPTDYTSLFASVLNLPSQSGTYPGDQVIFQFNNPDLASYTLAGNLYKANGQIGFQLSYPTDDTTWQPINGATIS
jgi:hypothetical protein